MIPLFKIFLSKWSVLTLVAASATTTIYLYWLNQRRIKDNLKAEEEENESISMYREDEAAAAAATVDEAQVLKKKGNVAYRLAQYEEAICCYSQAIVKCPKENKTELAIYHQNRAAAHEALQNWTEVLQDCTLSLSYNTRYEKAYFRRAKAYEALDELMECLEDLTAACHLNNFKNSTFVTYADGILKKMASEEAARKLTLRIPKLPAKNFIKSHLHFFENDPALKEVLSDNPNEESLHGFARASRAIKLQKYEDVVSACQEELDSDDAKHKAEAQLLIGIFHMFYGDFEVSKQLLSSIAENESFDILLRVYALLRRSMLYLLLEEIELAQEDCSTAQQLMPNISDIYLQRAEILMFSNKFPEVICEYERVLQISENFARAEVYKCLAEYRMAMISQDETRVIRLLTELTSLTEKHVDFTECYTILACVLSDQEQYQQADELYLKAMKLEPDNALLLVNRAILIMKWKQDALPAIILLEAAIKMDDKCVQAYETLGTIEVQRSNIKRAVELFNTAAEKTYNQVELKHLYVLRNAAQAQINVLNRMKRVRS